MGLGFFWTRANWEGWWRSLLDSRDDSYSMLLMVFATVYLNLTVPGVVVARQKLSLSLGRPANSLRWKGRKVNL